MPKEYKHRINFYFKSKRGLSYPFLINYLRSSVDEDLNDTIILVFNLRNCRDFKYGKGERSLGRDALQWLIINHPEEMEKFIRFIPEYGRWDDLFIFFPGYCDLGNLDFVRENYCSDINEKKLMTLRKLQKKVVKMFIDSLKDDESKMLENKPCSLAAKWAPTENRSLDYKYNLVSTICNEWGISPKKYRKKIGKLRSYFRVVEKNMCNKNWEDIEYSHLPKLSLKKYKRAFRKNDKARFEKWKEYKDKKPLISKYLFLLPHDIVAHYNKPIVYGTVSEERIIIESLWDKMVSNTEECEILKRIVPVIDTSGSMNSRTTKGDYIYDKIPINTALSLGTIISRCSQEPFKNFFINFSTEPSLFNIDDTSTLLGSMKQILKVNSTSQIDLYKVLELILEKVLYYKAEAPEMVLIMSDMDFEIADPNHETHLEEIRKKFKKEDLEAPKICFWNISTEDIKFFTSDEKDVYFISGFSWDIITAFITTGNFTPIDIVKEVIENSQYNTLRSLF